MVNNPGPKGAAGGDDESSPALPKWLLLATMGVLGAAATALLTWLAPDKTQWTFPARLVILIGTVTVLLFLSLGLFCLNLWRRTRTKVRYAILWNADKQPICAGCRGPLYVKDDYSFLCPVCNIKMEPRDDRGGVLSPRNALAKMHGRKSNQAMPSLKYPDCSDGENKILRLLAKRPRLSAQEIAAEVKISTNVAQLHLNKMFDDRFVQWMKEHQRIDRPSPPPREETLWELRDAGVAYLVERGWHK